MMGKRKRGGDRMKNVKDTDRPSSDNIPCTSGANIFCEESTADVVQLNENVLGSSSGGDRDTPNKILNSPVALLNHHGIAGRPVFLKRPRHYYGHHYSRRSHSKRTIASTSHSFSSSFEDKLSFMLAAQFSAQNIEAREKALNRAERMRSSSMIRDAGSSSVGKVACGICQKVMIINNREVSSPSNSEYAIVAVLVCGHVFHAGCLEGRTPLDETREPPCPQCLGLNAVEDA